MIKSKLKICVLGTRGFPNVQGGIETHCENLYPRLVNLGCEVTVFTRKGYVDPKISEFQGVRLVGLNCLRDKFLETFLHTLQGVFAARSTGCDVLHLHAVGPGFFAPLARMMGLKVVMTNHGPDYERKKWGWGAKSFLRIGEQVGTLTAHAVIAISQTIADHLRKEYKKNVSVIPNGVHLPAPIDTDDVLRKFNLNKGRYVLTIGRFVPEKGFQDLIDAFHSLEEKGNWKLVIVGDADHQDAYSRQLKDMAKRYPNIVLTGFQKGKDLAELFSHAGLFVLPSYHEGLPIVLLEAMSYGLSCLVSDIPANREVSLSEDRHFRVGDVMDLSKKLKHFMDHGALLADEKEKQLAKIKSRYNWDEIAENTLKVFLSVKTI